MRIALITAMTDDRVIGIDNRLPWHLPADMGWFRRNTLGKPVIMGRKTFESIGKPLPDRRNIVITRTPEYSAPGCTVVNSTEQALEAVRESGEVMVIGGASVYEQFLPHAHRLYLTLVHTTVEGDAWFPAYEAAQWHEVEREAREADADNPCAMSFVILERR